jgi:hypothetical protein
MVGLISWQHGLSCGWAYGSWYRIWPGLFSNKEKLGECPAGSAYTVVSCRDFGLGKGLRAQFL